MKLLGAEHTGGGRIERHWLHTGDDGGDRITVETVQDAEPVFEIVKSIAQAQTKKSAFRFKASLPTTMIDETSKINAKLWGMSVREAFAELIGQKSNRSKRVMKTLTEGRDFRKFQAKHYA